MTCGGEFLMKILPVGHAQFYNHENTIAIHPYNNNG